MPVTETRMAAQSRDDKGVRFIYHMKINEPDPYLFDPYLFVRATSPLVVHIRELANQ
jgi:hypothetical protein